MSGGRWRVMVRAPEGWTLVAGRRGPEWHRRFLNVTWEMCDTEAAADAVARGIPGAFVVSAQQYAVMPTFAHGWGERKF